MKTDRFKLDDSVKLPDTLHELLALALEDFEKVRQRSDVILDMGCWAFKERENEPCRVCLAGAVLVERLGLDLQGMINLTPGDLSYEFGYKLYALDMLRLGKVRSAYIMLTERSAGNVIPDGLSNDFEITQFQNDRDAFVQDLKQLQLRLKELDV